MRKILGITMGDPAGVGPEITVKALQDPKVYESCKPLVVGDAAILERACGFVGAKMHYSSRGRPQRGGCTSMASLISSIWGCSDPKI